MLGPAFLDLFRLHIQEADHVVAIAFVLNDYASVGGLQFDQRDLVVVLGEGLEQFGGMHEEDLELNSLVEDQTIHVRLEGHQASVLSPLLMQVGEGGRQSQLLFRGIQKHRLPVILEIMLLDLMQGPYEVKAILVLLLIGEGELHPFYKLWRARIETDLSERSF